MNKIKKGQVWVETVIYTLIGLTIIGILLGVAIPKIKQISDRSTIQQTIVALDDLNKKVDVVKETLGNKRIVEIRIKKGELTIEPNEEKIYYTLEDTGLKLTEPGENIEQGEIIIRTDEKNKKYKITLTLDYSGKRVDLSVDGSEDKRILQGSPTPYKLSIENIASSESTEGNPEINVDIKVI